MAAPAAAAEPDPIDDNDGNVVDRADLRKDASFSRRIIATGRHPEFNPRAQLGDFCHDGEDLAFKPTRFIDGAGTPVGDPKNSYAQLGAAITIPARRGGAPVRQGVAVPFADLDAYLRLENTLLTPNGAARGDVILEHMRKPGAPHPDTYKIGSYPVDELYLLTEEGGPMHRAHAIIQDSCPFNAFVSKKTGQPLIGAGINGGRLELNNSIIKQLDGADAPSENSINRNMRITTVPNDFTVHMFLPGYRFRYLKVNDTTLQVHIIKLIGVAWTPICEVTCKAGISVNAVCQAAGVPPPRGTGNVKNKIGVNWLQPAYAEPALLLYIKTLTDWAQVYHGAKLWYDYHILEPVLSFDTFCKEAAVWLDTPMFLLASPKGFVDVMVCDPNVLVIAEPDMAKIRGKFTEAKGNLNTNIILNAIHDTAVRELRNIPYLLTKSNVYCYFMASEIDTIIGDITRRRDALITDISNYPADIDPAKRAADIDPAKRAADIDPAKRAAEIKAFYQKYFSLTTKSIYEYMVDLVQPIVKLTDKYESINNRLVSALSTWKEATDKLINADIDRADKLRTATSPAARAAASLLSDEEVDASRTATALVLRMVGIMQSAGVAATDQTIGAWFSYLPLGGGALGKTRPQRIEKLYNQLPDTYKPHFGTYCAAHYKFDGNGTPKIGFARILGGRAVASIETMAVTYSIIAPGRGTFIPPAGGPVMFFEEDILTKAVGTSVNDGRMDHDNYSMSSEKYFKVLDARLLSILQIVQTIAEQGVEALTPPAAAAGAGAGAPARPQPEKLALQIAALAAIDAATAPAAAAPAAAVGGAGAAPAAAAAQPTSVFDSPELNIVKDVYDATCAQDTVNRLISVSSGTDEFTNVERPYAEQVSTSFVGLPLATLRAAVNVTKLAGDAAVKAVGWVNSMFGGIFCFRWRAGVAGGAGGVAPVKLQGDSHIPIQVGGEREDGELEYCFKFYPNAPVMYTKRGSKTLMHAVMERMNTIFFNWNIADEAHIPFGSDIDRYEYYDFATVDSRDRFIKEIMEGDGIGTNGILEDLCDDMADSDMGTIYMAGLENLRILYRLYKEDNALTGDEFLEQLACYLFFSDEISEVFEREFSWRLEIKEICLQLVFWIQNPQIGAADPRMLAAKLAVARGSDEGFSAEGAARGGSSFSAAAGGGGGGMNNSDDEDDSAAGGGSYEDDAFAKLSKGREAEAVEAYSRLRAAQEVRRARRARRAAAAAADAMLKHAEREGDGGGGGDGNHNLNTLPLPHDVGAAALASAGGGGGDGNHNLNTLPLPHDVGAAALASAGGGGGDGNHNLNTLPSSHDVGAVGSATAAAVEAVRNGAAAKAHNRITSAEAERKAAAGGKIGEAEKRAADMQRPVTVDALRGRVEALRGAINVRLAERARRMAGAAARQRATASSPPGMSAVGQSGSNGLTSAQRAAAAAASVGAKQTRTQRGLSGSGGGGTGEAAAAAGIGGGGLFRSSSAGGEPAAAAGADGEYLPEPPPAARRRISGGEDNSAAAPSGGGAGMDLRPDPSSSEKQPTLATLAAVKAAVAAAHPPGPPNPAFAAFAAPSGSGGGASPPGAALPRNGGGSPINNSEGGYRKPRRRSRKRSKHSSRRLTRRFG